ncbi:TetR/AcrR family transcriptional regulator [Evansella cellulosilytica]|uniref:Transcriptional regulator, TetR family n=1 Tax=Evansella cellulosilytica (strain ATCC 21833 / DSM 2522 / FERM P-1141 / JCM 9156 / N-4) TaxID=649639 RepID=E6TUS4_EVAC2|nr:TetR/AcrR family transcriptional regulator [Evansella cellulosilytica]ADU32076.1 transcriptional regulator, TetR family [Evansella cellulosilytica DSM 2522]
MESNKKARILEAATKSFAHFGYKATTVDQVAKIAKVGKGTIYTYFANKEELFKEIIDDLARQMRVVASELIIPGNSFISNFTAALHGVVEFREKHELTIKLSQEVKEMGTPVVAEALQSIENEICAFIESRIIKAVERGELRNCNPKITAFLMFKMYINLVSDWKDRYEPLPKEEVANLIKLYFIDGLGNQI